VDVLPRDHLNPRLCLRLRRLPVNELAHTVMVVKLEFGEETI